MAIFLLCASPMGRARSKHGKDEKCVFNILVKKTVNGTQSCICENNIKVNIKGMS